jgi:sugar O-acyltransferase (sialic acid O-acetyltransferase NeuD family)
VNNQENCPKEIIIIGAGGFGRDVLWLLNRINAASENNEWDLLGFVDDNPEMIGKIVNGVPVLGTLDYLLAINTPQYVVCSINKPNIRESMVLKCKQNANLLFPALIDPTAIIGQSISIGEGCVICANSILTIDVSIGAFCLINLICTIEHDSIISEFSTLYPRVSVAGNDKIGRCSEIGTGTQLIQRITIGDNVILGAGSVVVHDIPDSCTAVGVPAKPIKFHFGKKAINNIFIDSVQTDLLLS